MEKETCCLKVLPWYMKIVEPNLVKIKSNWQKCNNYLPKMKSTTYIAVITTHKAEKYLSEGRKLGSTSLLTCSPAHFLSTCTPPTTPPPLLGPLWWRVLMKTARWSATCLCKLCASCLWNLKVVFQMHSFVALTCFSQM